MFGNNISCKVRDIGTIRLKMHDGMKRILSEVRYISDIKRNLISLGTLDSSGYTFKAEDGVLKIQKGSLVIMKGFKKNSLYTLQGTTVIGRSSMAQTTTYASKLWHLRLGHVSEQRLVHLSKHNLLCGDKFMVWISVNIASLEKLKE